ncbi:MAG: zinc-ribbon domain-containing protein, partial [Anaerolineales bacterium]
MKCSNCGTENPERVKFCHECGSSLAVEQSPGDDVRLASLQQSAPD